jgi:DNA-binding NtrC family response regulator
MRQIRGQVRLAIAGRPQVTISGPPGSGREHLARTIHYHETEEAAPPLVPLSCALLDAELLQSTVEAFVRSCAELETERPAALLLLDADQLPRDAQAALMGFLNIPEFDLHVIATTRQPLAGLAGREEFRPDLACALSTLVIELPDLCRRREDIPLLAQLFVEQENAAGKRQIGGFVSESLDELTAYPWPGNLDELAAAVREAHARAEGPFIQPEDLPQRIRLAADAAAYSKREEETVVLDEFLGQIEAEVISRALRRAKGNKTKAASLLGINRTRLLRRIDQLGLDE